jgi:hypothetical protein
MWGMEVLYRIPHWAAVMLGFRFSFRWISRFLLFGDQRRNLANPLEFLISIEEYHAFTSSLWRFKIQGLCTLPS